MIDDALFSVDDDLYVILLYHGAPAHSGGGTLPLSVCILTSLRVHIIAEGPRLRKVRRALRLVNFPHLMVLVVLLGLLLFKLLVLRLRRGAKLIFIA